MSRIAPSLFCLLVCLALGQPAHAQNASIDGTWLITAVLIATSTPTPQVREGFTKQETWVIAQRGGQARLTTPNGRIDGVFSPNHPDIPGGAWSFQAQIPNFGNQPNLHCGLEVTIADAISGRIEGGTKLTWYGNDAWTGQLVPLGGEAWRFEGVRR